SLITFSKYSPLWNRGGLKMPQKPVYNLAVVPYLVTDWNLVKAYRTSKVRRTIFSRLSSIPEKRWSEVSAWPGYAEAGR
ncbi:MAG: hypothetical protein Q8L01_00800, partial [Candidatus Woesebacteria bacterium]|nr:hypothetical protein [Candidatus Woesebacteria bacterium]